MPAGKFGTSLAQINGQTSGQAYSESGKIRDAHPRSTDGSVSGAESHGVIDKPPEAPVKYVC